MWVEGLPFPEDKGKTTGKWWERGTGKRGEGDMIRYKVFKLRIKKIETPTFLSPRSSSLSRVPYPDVSWSWKPGCPVFYKCPWSLFGGSSRGCSCYTRKQEHRPPPWEAVLLHQAHSFGRGHRLSQKVHLFSPCYGWVTDNTHTLTFLPSVLSQNVALRYSIIHRLV